MSMRRIVLALVAIVAFAITGKAQSNSDRLSLGVGCLYQNGLDFTLSYEHEGKYHHAWEFLPTVTSSGPNAPPASISVPNHSGRITEAMGSVSPTSLVWYVGAIITAMSVSVRRQEVIPVVSWEASTSDMSTIMYCVVAGSCSARSRPI